MSDVAEPVAVTRFDELRDGEGLVRPHWRAFARTLSQLSPEEFERRQAAARATVQDNGVTYNVYDDRGGKARPWQLDIVPFILSASDWEKIEAAVIQRAGLADMLLRDLYGPQRLIRENVLPPHLVTGHPHFLRPLCGTKPAHDVHVHLVFRRSGARSRRFVESDGQPSRCAGRTGLCAGKPPGGVADLSGEFRRSARGAAGGFLQRL